MRKVKRTVPAPEDLGTEVIGIPVGTDLEMDLRLEAVMEGVLVSGSVRGLAIGECVRCLEKVELPLDVKVQELFVYPERAKEFEGDEDLREVEDEYVQVESSIRDAVVLALPFQPVCREDCPGLCSECGALLAEDPEHHHDVADPRWTALQGIVLDAPADETKES